MNGRLNAMGPPKEVRRRLLPDTLHGRNLTTLGPGLKNDAPSSNSGLLLRRMGQMGRTVLWGVAGMEVRRSCRASSWVASCGAHTSRCPPSQARGTGSCLVPIETEPREAQVRISTGPPA